jgi:hypothetical protein
MDFGWRHALTIVALAFLLFLVGRLVPLRGRRSRGEVAAALRAARERARLAETPRARAEALCEGAVIAAERAHRWTASAGLFLRAMRADPTWAGAVEHARRALTRRPRLLESILWRRLALLRWEGAERGAAKATAEALASLPARGREGRARADVVRRLAERL